ncbi:hypothetical protein [Alkalihalobacterium elongatum]|uniref:hypothetical protein n=1 Tax=Alkalihalobacterium elongatum TaxID=2675466 RepID=UPI001C1FC662|nr:hypothetical protein [Alkalihalobacterium elongatum]
MDGQEKVTMSKRIQAFYDQSGGPNNPNINRIIQNHLLNGKDHGIPGKRETFKDAFLEVFLDDHSTKDLLMWILAQKFELQDRWKEFIDRKDPTIERLIDQLTKSEQKKWEEIENRLKIIEYQSRSNSSFEYKQSL